MPAPFSERLADATARCGAPACVGIDPHLDRLPVSLRRRYEGLRGDTFREAAAAAVREWALGVVDVVAGQVPIVKPQSAFFEALGARGVAVLEEVVAEARRAGLMVLLDNKRGDIGSTAAAYARVTMEPGAPCESDAVTLSPYLGIESLTPFLDACDAHGKGMFVLVRTSNPGSYQWQLERSIAPAVADQLEAWSAQRADVHGYGPVGAVVAANLPDEIDGWRARMGHCWFLMPGFGAQGATASDVAPLVAGGRGALIAASRSVLFPPAGAVEPDWKAGVDERCRAFVVDLRGVC